MICADVQCIGTPAPRMGVWHRIWTGWRRRRVIDIRTLPEHLQRDIGYLDGIDPAGRHE